jgi:hypothetical protein
VSTAEILTLGAIAGLTIFIGLPMGKLHNVGQGFKAFLSATATGILLFLFWDVLVGAIEPVETVSTSCTLSFMPSRMIKPLPKARSIWDRAASIALDLSVSFSAGGMSTTFNAGWAIWRAPYEGVARHSQRAATRR